MKMNHCVKLKIKCVFPRQAEKGFSVEKGSSFRREIVLPCNSSLKNSFLEEYHSSPLGSHLGVEKTHKLLAANLYGTVMNDGVKEFVAACVICQQKNQKIPAPQGYSNLYLFPFKFGKK